MILLGLSGLPADEAIIISSLPESIQILLPFPRQTNRSGDEYPTVHIQACMYSLFEQCIQEFLKTYLVIEK